MSLPPPVKSDAARERSWRPVSVSAGLTERRRRLLWFGFASLSLLLLYYWMIRRPIDEPQVQLVGLPSSGESFDSRWTVRASQETLDSQFLRDGLQDLRQQLSAGTWEQSGRTNTLSLSEPPDARRLRAQLQTVSRSATDVLVLLINTQAVNRDGRLLFSWDRGSEPDGRWWDARHLIDALRSHPAALKFVVLDAGQTQWAPQQGIVLNDYLSALRAQLRVSPDPALWFLCSHATGEISHIDHQHHSTLFNLAVLQGMQGEADLDRSGVITVRELTQYTVFKVDAWSRQYAGYQFRQTPQILWGGGDLDVASDWPGLIPVVETPNADENDESNAAPPDDAAASGSETAAAKGDSLRMPALRLRSGPMFAGRYAPLGLMFQTPVATATPASPATPPTVPAESAPDAPSSFEPNAANPAAKPSPSSESAAGKKPAPAPPAAKAVAEDDQARELSPSEQALQAAWTIHDRLADPAPSARWTAAGRFPLEFRRLEQELIRLEFLSRSLSDADRAGWNRQVERIASRFEAIETLLQRPLALPTDSEPIGRLRSGTQPHSLALARLLGEASADEEFARFEGALSNLLQAFARNDRKSQLSLASELESGREWIEIALACRLAELPPTENGRFPQAVLQNRMRLEKLAARSFGHRGWIENRLRLTGQTQARGEALVLNRIPGTLERDGERLLDAVAFELDGIDGELRVVLEAERLTATIGTRLGDYLQLSRLSGDAVAGFAPSPGELSQLVQLLASVSQPLQSPDPARLPQLARDVRALRNADRLIRNRIDESVRQLTERSRTRSSQLGWRREVLLRSPLLKSSDRLRLWEALDAVSPTDIEGDLTEIPALAGLVSPALSPRTIDALNAHVGLQAATAEWALSAAAPSEAELQNLRAAADLSPGWSDETLLVSYADAARQLEEIFAEAHERMLGELPPKSTDLNPRLSGARLQSWTVFSRVVSPAVAGRRSELEPAGLLTAESLRDLLAWQIERLEQLQIGGAMYFADEAASAQRNYRRALRAIWPAYSAGEAAPPSIELLVPESLTLSRSESPTLKVVCRNNSDEAIEGTLAFDFDAATVGVRVVSPALESAPVGLAARLSGREPFADRTSQWKLRLEPRDVQIIDLALECRSQHCRLSPLVVTWLARADVPQAGPREIEFAQRAIRLQHPFSDAWSLSVSDGPAVRENGRPVLHPFPNRETAYRLQLSYLGDDSVDVDVVLADIASAAATLQQRGLTFSANAAPFPLDWSTGRADRPAATTQGVKAAVPRVERPIGSRLELRILDRASGRIAAIPVPLQTQRPRRYVRPTVSYDSHREVVRVVIEPRSGMSRPSGPISIVCRLEPEPGSKAKPVEAAATLATDSDRQELTLRLPLQIGGTRELSLAVDGVAREFVYRIPTDQSIAAVPEIPDRSRLAIVAPHPEAAFPLPGDSVPLELQVDLPVADRLATSSAPIAEVWLDAIPNGRRDPVEPVVRIDTDREVKLTLIAPDETGVFNIATSVSDWQLPLPGSGLPEGRVELHGELRTSPGTFASAPVAIVLDGTPPELASSAPESIAVKAPFPITVTLAEEDASGLARVEAQLDLRGDGRFDPEKPVVTGVRSEPAGDWRCLIPTDGLTPGRHTVLLRGYDAVGNASDVLTQPMVVLSAEQLAAMSRGASVPVTGVVVFGKDPVPNVTVTLSQGGEPSTPDAPPAAPSADAAKNAPAPLTAKTDAAGRFRFEDVPAGEYTLRARVLLLNRFRIHEESIRVEPPPASAGISRIRLK